MFLVLLFFVKIYSIKYSLSFNNCHLVFGCRNMCASAVTEANYLLSKNDYYDYGIHRHDHRNGMTKVVYI